MDRGVCAGDFEARACVIIALDDLDNYPIAVVVAITEVLALNNHTHEVCLFLDLHRLGRVLATRQTIREVALQERTSIFLRLPRFSVVFSNAHPTEHLYNAL